MVAFSLIIYDSADVIREGVPGEVKFSMHGMTVAQAEAALGYLKTFTKKLEEFTDREEVRQR